MCHPTFPRSNDKLTCHLKEIISKPNIIVGEYTYYHDFDDPRQFENRNILYHYPVNGDRLIIGRFCSIASGAKFLFNGGQHKSASFVNYPFAIFGELFQHALPVNASWDNRGDIVIGNDVWIGYEALIMSGVHIGNGARIASRAVVTRDVQPYETVGGIPARRLNLRFDHEIRTLLEELRWWDMDISAIKAHLPILMNDNPGDLRELVRCLRMAATSE